MALGRRGTPPPTDGVSVTPRLLPGGQDVPASTDLPAPSYYPPDLNGAATADGTGMAVVLFDPVPQGATWALEWLRVATDELVASDVNVYDGAESIENRIARSNDGDFDELDYTIPKRLRGGSQLRFVWTGMAPGARAQARVQYRIIGG